MQPMTLKTLPALVAIVLSASLLGQPGDLRAQSLTPEDFEAIKARANALRDSLTQHLATRNLSAGDTFARAARDPREAVELYVNSHKLVNYDRENRPDADFRAWRDSQSGRLRDSAFVESLQMQLHYLALSCKAAETEDTDAVFSQLLAYVDGLSRMENLPTQALTSSVAGSVFARAYYLERLLGSNDNWEPVPFNIDGIYEKTILPHLRRENPGALMNAWDKRIEQTTRLVEMIEQHRQSEMRGLSRQEQIRERTNQKRQGGVLARLDKEEFVARTLPKLRWARLKDQFSHVNAAEGSSAMLSFVEQHLTHELGEEFFDDFMSVIDRAASAVAVPSPQPAPAGSGEE